VTRPRWLKHPGWLWIIGLVLAFAALHYAARFPWLVTWNTLADANWGLLAAAGAINLLSLAAKAWAWQLLVRPFGPLTFRTAQAATFAGAAINAIGVAMSGEAGRIHLASSRDGVGAGLATRSVVASRIVEAAALGIFLLGVVAGVASEHGWRLLGGGVLLIGGALALLRWIPWLRPGRGEGAAVGWTTAQLAAPLGLNVGSWGLQWATYHWSIVATGANVSPALSVLALVLSNVGGILRLTPGNVGVVQGAVVLGLRPAGIEASRAVAAGVALQAVQVLPVLLIGVALLGRHGMRELARRRAVEPA
jgi:putative heme transporter